MSVLGRVLTLVEAINPGVTPWLTSPGTAHLIGECAFRFLGMRRKREDVSFLKVERVLVIRLDEIGDLINSTPFLRELRRNLPRASITLVVKPAVRDLVERCPYVNEVVTYDWSTPLHRQDLHRHERALRLAWQHLWRRRFDLAIVPRWDTDYYHAQFVAYFSGARWRMTYSEGVTEEKRLLNAGLNRLFTHVFNSETIEHEVQRSLGVIRFLGGTIEDDRLELWIGEEDQAFVKRTLESYGVHRNDVLIALGPGAGSPKRMWPVTKFLELSDWVIQQTNIRIIVLGGQGEESLGQLLHCHLGERVINMVGRTTLRQAGALLKRCQLFVGNDAGPMHLAAAAGVPVVEISCHPRDGSPHHYNSPVRFRAWGVPHHVLQPETAVSPCIGACNANHAHCIETISVDQVKEAALAQLTQNTESIIFHTHSANGTQNQEVLAVDTIPAVGHRLSAALEGE